MVIKKPNDQTIEETKDRAFQIVEKVREAKTRAEQGDFNYARGVIGKAEQQYEDLERFIREKEDSRRIDDKTEEEISAYLCLADNTVSSTKDYISKIEKKAQS